MYRITETIFYSQISDTNTIVSIRRSKIEDGSHHRLTIDCLTFSQNQDYLHQELIKLQDETSLDFSLEPQLKDDLDALKTQLITKGWVPGNQIVVDYRLWLLSQNLIPTTPERPTPGRPTPGR